MEAAHNGRHEESEHPYLNCVPYLNLALDGQSSVGCYGTDEALDCLWEIWTRTFSTEPVKTLHSEFRG
jgi:hypothetical protein